jgi:hypothetical protein
MTLWKAIKTANYASLALLVLMILASIAMPTHTDTFANIGGLCLAWLSLMPLTALASLSHKEA